MAGVIWHKVAELLPPRHVVVLLFRKGTLYPVVGACWGCDPHGDNPDRVLWTLEEGGMEDGAHRGYPFLHESAEPTHWAHLPEVP